MGREDLLEKGMVTTSVFLPGKSYGQRSLVGYSPRDHKRVRHDIATKQQEKNDKWEQTITNESICKGL